MGEFLKGAFCLKNQKYFSVIIFVLIIAGCLLWIILQNMISQESKTAQISVGGEVIQTVDLNKNQEFTIQGENHILLHIMVQDGKIYVQHSDCPDKICEQRGKISKTGENIVCLPARTVIEVINGEKNDLDN